MGPPAAKEYPKQYFAASAMAAAMKIIGASYVDTLDTKGTDGSNVHLGGPETITWREILTRLAAAKGRKKLMLPAPALGVMAAAALLDRFESFPITRDQLRMLLEGNACPQEDLAKLGLKPQPFSIEALRYLNEVSREIIADTPRPRIFNDLD